MCLQLQKKCSALKLIILLSFIFLKLGYNATNRKYLLAILHGRFEVSEGLGKGFYRFCGEFGSQIRASTIRNDSLGKE